VKRYPKNSTRLYSEFWGGRHCNLFVYIVKIENGFIYNPTIETLIKITESFEVGVDDLIK